MANERYAEDVERHFEEHVGEVDKVLHELVSDRIHLDVHLIPPGPERDHWTLFTTGMSDLPMTVPDGCEELRFAELMILLPKEWRVEDSDEAWSWPIRWLKQLARLPHDYETWLGSGHTVPNGDPPEPFVDGTELCCWLVLPPISLPDGAHEIQTRDGNVVNLYTLHALHADELQLKLDEGTDALLDEFERVEQSEVLAPGRPSILS